MEKDHNFSKQPHQNEPICNFHGQSSSSSDQDVYISQFLHPSAYLQNQKYQYQTISSQQSCQKHKESKQLEPMESESEKSPENKSVSTKSVFHNLQKHLVIALRNLIQIQKNHTSNGLAVKMWQIFISSNKFTKNGLHILFGFFQPNEDQDIETIYYNYGFGDLIQKYSVVQIRQAQNFLRNVAFNQLRSGNLEQYIEKTRIKRKQQFLQYMIAFIKQLEQGPLKKRLSKQTSSHLTKNIIKEQYIKRRSPRRSRQ